MPQYQEFFYKLLTAQEYVRNNVIQIKNFIGDSVENNRTLSVNQTLRYVGSIGRKESYTFGTSLFEVFNVLKKEVVATRKTSNKRTDAIDINELVTTYRSVVMNNRKYRQQIGQVLSKVG